MGPGLPPDRYCGADRPTRAYDDERRRLVWAGGGIPAGGVPPRRARPPGSVSPLGMVPRSAARGRVAEGLADLVTATFSRVEVHESILGP